MKEFLIDDNNQIFEVLTGKNQSVVQQTTNQPQDHLIMPEYWHNYAQFRTSNDEYIDNTDPTMSIQNLSLS